MYLDCPLGFIVSVAERRTTWVHTLLGLFAHAFFPAGSLCNAGRERGAFHELTWFGTWRLWK
jgi:hypothetical protein